ncbi:MAG: tripartite tricarboxylate transporter substrate binding protein [Rhodospirillales bacterium]|jgi:tripartite-type tricarboxylate transporter receptor subunit TctC|nr:tripartite tricarboxylate transporter substrate binding protein [Rhodospirillales bacterium]
MPSFLRRSLALSLAAPLIARAADPWPIRPIRMVVAFAPGGSIDVVARIMAQELGRALGQPVVVENRAGASGNLGADFVAKAAPDGYTLFMGSASSLGANAALFRNLPYDPRRDFAPVRLMGLQPNVIVVHPSLPVTDVAELIAYARANPGKLNFGTAGSGSAQHVAGDMFRRMAEIDMVHVPYRGGAPALSDLIAGQLQLMFETLPTAVEPIAAGQLRALAVTMPERVARLPNLPTVAESGLPGYVSRGWMGIVAPAGTDPHIIARLANESEAIIAIPAVRQRLLGLGLEMIPSSPAQFSAFIREEVASYQEVVSRMGIQLD